MICDAYEISARLAGKFAPPSWAFFREIKSSVGMGRRRIDGLAVAMWRSLGLEIQGFEIKTSRADWLRELKDAEKSDELFRYCDRWWVVVASLELVKDGELPPTWGLMCPHARGFKCVVKAPRLKPSPLTRDFVAEILRHQFNTPTTVKERSEYERGLVEGKSRAELAVAHDRLERERLEKVVADFEQASGIRLQSWSHGKEMGNAVRLVLDGRTDYIRRDLEHLRGQTKRILDSIESSLSQTRAAVA